MISKETKDKNGRFVKKIPWGFLFLYRWERGVALSVFSLCGINRKRERDGAVASVEKRG